MKHLDLFSGIGGFALAAQTVWENVEHTFVEIDPFCQAVLKKHWPESKIYGDIKTFTNTNRTRGGTSKSRTDANWQTLHEGQEKQSQSGVGRQIDLLTGGFPCQPFSQAGRRKGTEDNRYLWPEMFRVIREFSPTWVIAENVRGLVTWNNGMVLEQVCSDLESEGYEVWPLLIPAVAVNAPHRRERIWIIAHSKNQRSESKMGLEWIKDKETAKPSQEDTDVKNTIGKRIRGRSKNSRQVLDSQSTEAQNEGSGWPDWGRSWQEVAFATCHDRVDDGLPKRLARLPDGNTITEAKWRKEALKGYGNAIVPQVAIQIMRAIKDSHE